MAATVGEVSASAGGSSRVSQDSLHPINTIITSPDSQNLTCNSLFAMHAYAMVWRGWEA